MAYECHSLTSGYLQCVFSVCILMTMKDLLCVAPLLSYILSP